MNATPIALLPLALLAQSGTAMPPITGNPEYDGWARLGITFLFIWFMMDQIKKKDEARSKADSEKNELLQKFMEDTKKTFESGFNALQVHAQANTTEVHDLKNWIIGEIQDARKTRDSDPARNNDRKDN